MKRVWWAILPERCVYDLSFQTGLKVACRATARGFRPIYAQYGRTDITRQGIAEVFLGSSSEPTDTLVMLDVDHEHPPEIVERLAAHDVPVVVPLMFRRQEPYQACAFRRGPEGDLHHLASFPPGLHRMDGVGSGAIAIQRQVFERLQALGQRWFWQYEYRGEASPSEDMYFAHLCEAAGIAMYVDTTIESPHIGLGLVDQAVHDAFLADHPELSETLIPVRKDTDHAAIPD